MNCPLVIAVVVRLTPFHLTTDDVLNVDPFTVSIKPAPPAAALFGLIDVITGIGAFTLKLYADEL